jgi:hypothetical protein
LHETCRLRQAAGEIEKIFEEIANELSNLRIVG